MRRVFLILSAVVGCGTVLILCIGCNAMNTYPTLHDAKQFVDKVAAKGAADLENQTEELTKQHAAIGEAVGVPPEVQAEIDARVADMRADNARDMNVFRADTQRVVDEGVDHATKQVTKWAGLLRGEVGVLLGILKEDTKEDLGRLEESLAAIPVEGMADLLSIVKANPGKLQTALIEAGVPPVGDGAAFDGWLQSLLAAIAGGGTGLVAVSRVNKKVEDDRTARPPPVVPVVVAGNGTSLGGASS